MCVGIISEYTFFLILRVVLVCIGFDFAFLLFCGFCYFGFDRFGVCSNFGDFGFVLDEATYFGGFVDLIA